MANRVVVIDAGVIIQITKGATQVANALRELLKPGSSVEVYVTHQAYEELTSQPGKLSGGVGPDIPRTAAANKRLLEDLKIRVAPAPPGAWKNVMDTYQRNNKAGGLLTPEDLRSAAQATAIGAEFWSLDQKTFVKQPQNLQKTFPGLRIAPESQLPVGTQPADYRVGRKLMSLPPIEIDLNGRIVQRGPKGSGSGGG